MQLRLIDGVDGVDGPDRAGRPDRRGASRGGSAGRPPGQPVWQLDEKTRRSGRRGVAAARRALRRANPPAPFEPLRRAG